MHYRTLYKRISKKTGIDEKFVMIVLRAYSDILFDAILDAETVPLPNIGRFKVLSRSYKKSHLGGKQTIIPAGKKLNFLINKKTRNYVKHNPFVQLSKGCHVCHYYPPSIPVQKWTQCLSLR